jgi:plastocyanin
MLVKSIALSEESGTSPRSGCLRRVIEAAGAVAILSIVVACGGRGASSGSSPAGPGASVSEAADPGGALRYTRSTLSARSGEVRIHFTNMSAIPHNMTIREGPNGRIVGATPTFRGATKTLTLDLKRGTYTFYCSVPGHRAAGMHGILTVH